MKIVLAAFCFLIAALTCLPMSYAQGKPTASVPAETVITVEADEVSPDAIGEILPVHLDLYFLDNSGYAIIHTETTLVPLDATPELSKPHPIKNLEIIQTLDERQVDGGKLVLEVTSSTQGLVPELTDILDIAPEGFDVVDIKKTPPGQNSKVHLGGKLATALRFL